VAESQTFSFERTPDSVRAARTTLLRFDEELPATELYDASLCLSELVTNAIQHPGGGDDLELALALSDSALRVEVRDPGPGFDPGDPSVDDNRGWGLFIVDRLSSRWGVETGETTVVWFEIDRGRSGGDRDSWRAATPGANRPPTPEERGREIANAVARLRLGDAISF